MTEIAAPSRVTEIEAPSRVTELLANGMTGIVVALREELGPLLARATGTRRIARGIHQGTLGGAPVCLAVTGDGPERAGRAAGALLRKFRIRALIGAGLAGALTADLREGDVIAGREVRGFDGTVRRPGSRLLEPAARVADRVGVLVSGGDVRWTAAEKIALLAGHPGTESVAVDTESDAWARAAADADVPFLALRAVLDPAGEDLPAYLRGARRNGSMDRFAVAAHAFRHPSAIGELLRLRRRTRRAMEGLAERLVRFFALSGPSEGAAG